MWNWLITHAGYDPTIHIKNAVEWLSGVSFGMLTLFFLFIWLIIRVGVRIDPKLPNEVSSVHIRSEGGKRIVVVGAAHTLWQAVDTVMAMLIALLRPRAHIVRHRDIVKARIITYIVVGIEVFLFVTGLNLIITIVHTLR